MANAVAVDLRQHLEGLVGTTITTITGAPNRVVGLDDANVYVVTRETTGDGGEPVPLADRDFLRVHPRDDRERPERGVFSTRSQDRPNPIGLHRVRVVSVEGPRVRVSELEAIDGTPILDVKPVL